jgi:hypothetical protein
LRRAAVGADVRLDGDAAVELAFVDDVMFVDVVRGVSHWRPTRSSFLHHLLHRGVEQGVAGVAIHCTTHPLSLKGVVVVEQSKTAYCEVVQNHQLRPPILRL